MYTQLSIGVRAVRFSNVRTGSVLTTYESDAARQRPGGARRVFRGCRARPRAVTRLAAAARLSARPCPRWAGRTDGPTHIYLTDLTFLSNPVKVMSST